MSPTKTEAMTLGDSVAVMRAGVLQQCDAPQALYVVRRALLWLVSLAHRR